LFPFSGCPDGRLRRPGGHQAFDEAIRPDQQPLLVQHDDDGLTQPENRLNTR